MTDNTLGRYQRVAREKIESLPIATWREHGLYIGPTEDYLIGTYPPLKALEESADQKELYRQPSERVNLYVHIPFCKQYCTFCHFAKEINPADGRVDHYIEWLIHEIELSREHFHEKKVAETVFFGGGTPSYLDKDQIALVFDALNQCYDISSAEITYELHPQLIKREDRHQTLEKLKECGVNRWVCGVQSMDDRVLKKLNRGHVRSDVEKFVELLQEHECENLSLDLIYGLPHQTIENFYDSICSLVDLGIPKFNVFPLFFKPTDPIARHYAVSPEIFPTETERLEMKFVADMALKDRGYEYGPMYYYATAGSGKHSVQQSSKFENIEETNLIPFGISSFGYMSGTQFYRVPTVDEYTERLKEGRSTIWRQARLPDSERERRNIMFSLRADGVDIAKHQRWFGSSPVDRFADEFRLLEMLDLVAIDQHAIRLTEWGEICASGIGLLFFSDEVMQAVDLNEQQIANPRRDPLEQFDFSPYGRRREKDLVRLMLREIQS